MGQARERFDDQELEESAIYWFARYETGIEKGDFSLALYAQSQLKRLGYDVRRHKTARPNGSR